MDDSLSLVASDAEELSGSYHNPAPLHSAHTTQAWTPIFSTSFLTLWRSWVWNGLPQMKRPVAAWMNGSCQGAAKPLVNELRHSSQWSTTRSPNLGMHPTRTAYVPLLPPPSLRSTVRKKKDTTACLPWMSQWPPISARPGPLAGRQKPPTHPNRVGRLQLLLDEPIHRLDKRPQHFTPWRSCKCSRMRLNRTPQLLKSCTVRPTWPSVPPRWQLRRSADPWPV